MPDVIEKKAVGSFGNIITRTYYERYILPSLNHRRGWDMQTSVLARQDGLKTYATSPSFLQHIGLRGGIHKRGVAVACDFAGHFPHTVLAACMARNGDIIMASVIINALCKFGYPVAVLTADTYKDLADFVCPDAKRILTEPARPDNPLWGKTTTADMRRKYPGFEHYLNLQIGSGEQLLDYYASKKHPVDYLIEYAGGYIPALLGINPAMYLRHREAEPIELPRNGKPLCVVSPEAISSPVIGGEIFDKKKGRYDYLAVTKNKADLPVTNIYGYSFVDVIRLLSGLKEDDIFVGNDSGCAWAALYNSRCRKKIYHNAKRLALTHTKFSRLDNLAEDIEVKL
jgi:hypothetical protein